MHKKRLGIIVVFLVATNVLLLLRLVGGDGGNSSIAFLDVGQGDAALVSLPLQQRTVQVLIDGGPNASILTELSRVMPKGDRSIDLLVLSHPQLDHFGGLIDVLERYNVGAFIWTGRAGTAEAWNELVEKLTKKHILAVKVAYGDKIKIGKQTFTVLNPSQDTLLSGELNDSSLVMRLDAQGISALFTGDISASIEKRLPKNILRADILKVSHHGSKYSSADDFLRAVMSRLAVIEVGKNRYGHPSRETLERLNAAGNKIFRTDRNGTVLVRWKDDKILVTTSKSLAE
jgi:competence protein ComEC